MGLPVWIRCNIICARLHRCKTQSICFARKLRTVITVTFQSCYGNVEKREKHHQIWYGMKTKYNLVFCFESVLRTLQTIFHLLFGSVKGREWAPILSSLWWKAYAWLWFMLLKLLFTLLIVSFLVLLLGDCFIVKLLSFSLSTSRGYRWMFDAEHHWKLSREKNQQKLS